MGWYELRPGPESEEVWDAPERLTPEKTKHLSNKYEGIKM